MLTKNFRFRLLYFFILALAVFAGSSVVSLSSANAQSDQCHHTCPEGFVPVEGQVFYDITGDSIRDSFENGVNGLPVKIYTQNNEENCGWELYSQVYSGHKPGTPSDDGYWQFCVPEGNYYIEYDLPDYGLDIVTPNVGNDLQDSEITGMNGENTTNTFTVTADSPACHVDGGVAPEGTGDTDYDSYPVPTPHACTPPTPTPEPLTTICIEKIVTGNGPLWAKEFTIGIDDISNGGATSILEDIGMGTLCADVDPAGDYQAYEVQAENYTLSFSGECDASGVFVPLVAGGTYLCTLTNDYTPEATPEPTTTSTPTPHVCPDLNDQADPSCGNDEQVGTGTDQHGCDVKVCVPADPEPTATPTSTPEPTTTSTPTPHVCPDLNDQADPNCGDGEQIGTGTDQHGCDVKVCVPKDAVTLCVKKVVVGGSLSATDFNIGIKAAGTTLISGAGPEKCKDAKLGDWRFEAFETAVDGYAASFSGDCNPGGVFSENYAAGTLTCTITNTYIVEATPTPHVCPDLNDQADPNCGENEEIATGTDTYGCDVKVCVPTAPVPTAEPTPVPPTPSFCELNPTHRSCVNLGGTAEKCEDCDWTPQAAPDRPTTNNGTLWNLFRPREVAPEPLPALPPVVEPSPERDADNFWQTKVVPQTGSVSPEMMQVYGAHTPFADLNMGDEDFYPSLALYLQGVLQLDDSNEIMAQSQLTGQYVIDVLEKVTGFELSATTYDVINYGQARASIEDVLNMDLYAANALTDDLYDKGPDTSITRGDFHDLLYRAVTAQDNGEGMYYDSVEIVGGSLPINEVSAKRVILSNPAGWLNALEDGAGFYQDVREGHKGRIVLFGHSSRYSWMDGTNIAFSKMVNANAVGKTIELNVNGEIRTYEVTSKEKIDQYDVDSLKYVDADEDLTIFTCDYPDLDSRWVYHASEVK